MKDRDGKFIIKSVAVYLRKSRGEGEKDLDNHRNALVDVCTREGWKYVLFEEIASGESLEMRPEAQKLLKYIEEEVYDAILVMDIDRLSRAGTSEFEMIKTILIDSDTILVIKDRPLDLANAQDDMTYEIQAFVAKLEYKMIKKRLKQGKFQNALTGHWSNGNPPLPYKYNKETRLLYIDDTMKRTYRYIIDSVVIGKKPTNQIAYELNEKKWLTAGRKGNKYWTSKTVRDTLIDKVHLDYEKSGYGHIVIGKTKGNAHTRKPSTALKYKRIDKNDWFTFKGLHEALKTKEEHDTIELFLSRKTKAPKKTTAKKLYPLTGLIKCSFCGHFLGFTERLDRKGLLSVKNCWYVDPFGNKCANKSSSVQLLIDKIHESIEKHIKEVKEQIDTVDTSRLSSIDEEFKINKKFLTAKDIAIDRLDKAYQAGVYSIDDLKKLRADLKSEKEKILEDIRMLKLEQKYLIQRGKIERVELLIEFKEIIKNPDLTWEEQNELYKTLIDYITYKRVDRETKIEITFK
jgi:site-specific DNA recombinase